MHACNPSTLGGRGRQIFEFEASLVYRVSSRTARAIWRNSLWKNKAKQNKTTTKNERQLWPSAASKCCLQKQRDSRQVARQFLHLLGQGHNE